MAYAAAVRHRKIPIVTDRVAVEHRCKKRCDSPGHINTSNNNQKDAKPPYRKNSVVEEEDGRLYCCDIDTVG